MSAAESADLSTARVERNGWKDRALNAEAYVNAQSAAIQRVRDIHQPIDAVMYAGKAQHMKQVCTGCGQDDGNWSIWPCPTIKALDEVTP